MRGGDARGLVKAQRGQVLPAYLSKRLTAFWSINGGKPHRHLLIGAWRAATGFDGVAICDADDKAEQRCNQGLVRAGAGLPLPTS